MKSPEINTMEEITRIIRESDRRHSEARAMIAHLFEERQDLVNKLGAADRALREIAHMQLDPDAKSTDQFETIRGIARQAIGIGV